MQDKLPIDASLLLPHKAPMLLIDKLLKWDEGGCVCSSNITQDNPWVDKNGYIADVCLLEFLAQTTAAHFAYRELSSGNTPGKGYLVGVSEFNIFQRANVSLPLTINMIKKKSFDAITIVHGTIIQNSKELAEGGLRVWEEQLSS